MKQEQFEKAHRLQKEIKQARDQTREYGKLYRRFWFLPSKICYPLQLDPLGYDCYIDLYDFAYNLKQVTTNQNIKNNCDQVMQNLEKIIIANKVMPNDTSHGLFIYFPQYKIQYDESIWRVAGNPQYKKIPSSYDELDLSEDTKWDEFLKTYLKI